MLKEMEQTLSFFTEWENYYKQTQIGEEFSLKVTSSDLIETSFVAYHYDLCHQGRDRTFVLFKRRFFWHGMTKIVIERVQKCGSCSRVKTHGKAA